MTQQKRERIFLILTACQQQNATNAAVLVPVAKHIHLMYYYHVCIKNVLLVLLIILINIFDTFQHAVLLCNIASLCFDMRDTAFFVRKYISKFRTIFFPCVLSNSRVLILADPLQMGLDTRNVHIVPVRLPKLLPKLFG